MKPTVKSLPTFFACDLCRALVAGTLFSRFFFIYNYATPLVEERNGFSSPTIKHQHTSMYSSSSFQNPNIGPHRYKCSDNALSFFSKYKPLRLIIYPRKNRKNNRLNNITNIADSNFIERNRIDSKCIAFNR